MLSYRLKILLLICLGAFLPAVTSASTEIAITIDDLPVHGAIPSGATRLQVAKDMLGTLKKHHLQGIYGFINAERVTNADTQGVLTEWVAAGQKLGNHTFSHPDLNTTTISDYEMNIKENEPTLSKLFSGNFHWFRYPFLDEGLTQESRDAIRAFLAKENYKTAQVSYTFGDWNWQDPYARCVNRDDEKAIGLLEQSYLDAAAEALVYNNALSQQLLGREIPYVLLIHIGAFTTRMLDRLLTYFEKENVKFISLESASSDPAYQINPNLVSEYTGPFLDQIRRAKQLPPPFVLKKKFPADYAKLCQ